MNLPADPFQIEMDAHKVRISEEELARMIDHTLLRPNASKKEIEKLINEAKKFHFYAVCVNPYWVKYVKELIGSDEIKVATVIGFPLGATSTESKVAETKKALTDGADEFDMVMNIGAFKSKDYNAVENDIKEVVKAAEGRPVKVILGNGYLTFEEIKKASNIALKAGAAFVKTATGFGPLGAMPIHVKVMRDAVGDKAGVKAAGGIRTYEDVARMIAAGATRIGTSSGVNIIKTYRELSKRDFEFPYDIPCKLCPSAYVNPKMPQDIQEYYSKMCEKCKFRVFKKLISRT
ncbi:MAG: deoxyribose-phosphate aldolase [Candidatus Asgardarchaeia archaeon]